MKRCTALAVLLLTIATPAAAEEPTSSIEPFPNLATLDRTTDHSSGNSSVGMSFFGDDGRADRGACVDLFGQYIIHRGLGAYASLPVSYLSGGSDAETAIGNAELGGVYTAPQGDTVGVVVRGGLVLPTGPNDLGKVNVGNWIPRTTEMTSVSQGVTWIRLAGSMLHRQGPFFLRADLGFDVVVDEPATSDGDSLMRVNFAVGVDTGPVTVAGEFVTVGAIGTPGVHTAAFSVGLDVGKFRPYGALILPVFNEPADELLDHMFAVMVGVEVPLAAL